MLLEDKEFTCKHCSFSSLKEVFSPDDYYLLEENKGVIECSAGEVIIKQGSFTDQMLFLRRGIVKVVFEEKNKQSLIQLIEEGCFVGIQALVNSDRYKFSIIAYTDCHLCVVRKDVLLRIFHHNNLARNYFYKKISEEFDFLYKRIAVLSSRNNHGKLSTTLLYLSQNKFGSGLLQDINRKVLASFASISLESCNKILSELKGDGIIDLDGSGIRLLKPDLLKVLSSVG